jgi:hypothetical protein
MFLIKILLSDKLAAYFFEFDLPFIYNVPYEEVYGNQSPLTKNTNISFNLSSCLQVRTGYDTNIIPTSIIYMILMKTLLKVQLILLVKRLFTVFSIMMIKQAIILEECYQSIFLLQRR